MFRKRLDYTPLLKLFSPRELSKISKLSTTTIWKLRKGYELSERSQVKVDAFLTPLLKHIEEKYGKH